MTRRLVLTSFHRSFEEKVSNAFIDGESLDVSSVFQDKNINYNRGITPEYDSWGMINDPGSFLAIVAPAEVRFHKHPCLFCSFEQFEIVAIGDAIANYSDMFNGISPKWAYYWALRVGNRDSMRQVLLSSRSKFYSKCWINNINPTDKELIKISLEVNN